MITLDTGICCAATCNQPPGAAHRSIHTRDDWRNSYFRFNCNSLKAARDLKPTEKQTLFNISLSTNADH